MQNRLNLVGKVATTSLLLGALALSGCKKEENHTLTQADIDGVSSNLSTSLTSNPLSQCQSFQFQFNPTNDDKDAKISKLTRSLNSLSSSNANLELQVSNLTYQVSNFNNASLSSNYRTRLLEDVNASLSSSNLVLKTALSGADVHSYQNLSEINRAMVALNLPDMKNYVIGEFNPSTKTITNLVSMRYNGGKALIKNSEEFADFNYQVAKNLIGIPSSNTDFEEMMFQAGASLSNVRAIEVQSGIATVFDDVAYFSRNVAGPDSVITYTNKYSGNIMVGAENLSQSNFGAIVARAGKR